MELGCMVGALPSLYLDLPLGAPHNSTVVWDGVEERFHKRLALWRKLYISKGRLYYECLESYAKIGKDSKGFPFGVGSFGKKASSCEMVDSLF